MKAPSVRPPTIGSRSTRVLPLSYDQHVNGFTGSQLFFEMKLRRFIDISKKLIERLALGMYAVVNATGAPHAIFVLKNSDLYNHRAIIVVFWSPFAKFALCFGCATSHSVDAVADELGELPDLLHELLEVFGQYCLGAVAERPVRATVDFDDRSLSARGNAGQRQRRDQVALPRCMGRIDEDWQMRALLNHGNR